MGKYSPKQLAHALHHGANPWTASLLPGGRELAVKMLATEKLALLIITCQ